MARRISKKRLIKKLISFVIVLLSGIYMAIFKNDGALSETLDKDTIRVANWNVQNLFDTKKDGTEYKQYIPNLHNWNKRIFTKKIKNLSQVICDLNADVIGLEEVESDLALSELQKYLKRVGCEYKYRAITSSKKTAVHTALLSKIPIKSKKDIKVGRRGLYRSILEVTLRVNPPLKIFVNHWSSKMHPESKRMTYAKYLKKRIDSLPKGSEFIILGDFNSNYDEFLHMDKRLDNTNGKTGINHVLETVQGDSFVRLSYFKRVDDSSKLYNLWLELPKSKRWSYKYYKKHYSLDSIIIPASMVNDKGWEYVEDSFNVFKPSYLFTKRGAIFKWKYKHKHLGKGYSDHLPVYALFKRVSKENPVSYATQGLLSSFQPQQQSTPQKVSNATPNIENLLKGNLTLPVVLKDVVVIFKRKNSAIIKESPKGLGVLVYGGAKELELGRTYTIKVHKTKDYYGTFEIIDFDILSKGAKKNIRNFIEEFTPSLMSGDLGESRVVKNIRGTYSKGFLEVDGKKFKIYFRDKSAKPTDGSKLIIKIAQIGYYKGLKELIIWGRDDYKILE